MVKPLMINLPTPPNHHDSCQAIVRVAAVESRLDALTDEVHGISAEVSRFAESAADFKASLARTEALNVEIGLQLKRFAEFAERNQRHAERSSDLDGKLTEVIVALRMMTDGEIKTTSKRKAKR